MNTSVNPLLSQTRVAHPMVKHCVNHYNVTVNRNRIFNHSKSEKILMVNCVKKSSSLLKVAN